MNVVVGVTGSIAAYKACELVRSLVKNGHKVRVVMTKAATKFVSELTFRTLSQNKVSTDLFEEGCDDWKPEHIDLANFADVFVVAPCTANVLAKFANGMADDALTATYLASTDVRKVIAPSMNVKMWENVATQANVKVLKDRGVKFVGPDEGDLACGVKATGRMCEVSEIMNVLEGGNNGRSN